MSFYLDIKLPIGIKIEASYKEQFYGTLKSLLAEVLKDLEDATSKNYQYFMRERLSSKEKIILRKILQEVQEEHQNKLGLSMENQTNQTMEIDLNPILRRYQCLE